MPMDRSLYPDNWEAIATDIKTQANWTSEECGKPCRRPNESDIELFDRLRQHDSARWLNELFGLEGDGHYSLSSFRFQLLRLQRFTLTVSHTNHDPWNPDADLRALCASCHCRYDIDPVQMERKRNAKLEYHGQLTLI